MVGMLVGGQPMFQLLISGEAVLTATGASSVFDTFFMLLKRVQQAAGDLGGRSLQFLGLGAVLQKHRPLFKFFSLPRLLGRFDA